MKVIIKTIFGERNFDIPESVAADLIELAEEAQEELFPQPVKCGAAEIADRDDNPRPYKGFLHIKCEKCGRTKSFCSSRPLYYHHCECRHNTPLLDLAPVKAICKCGKVFKYMTNVVDPHFTMRCMECGNPIELELDGHGTSYVTKTD